MTTDQPPPPPAADHRNALEPNRHLTGDTLRERSAAYGHPLNGTGVGPTLDAHGDRVIADLTRRLAARTRPAPRAEPLHDFFVLGFLPAAGSTTPAG